MSHPDTPHYKYLEDELYRAVIEVLAAIRRRWYVPVLGGFLGLVASLIHLNGAPSVYTATAAIVPNPSLAEFQGNSANTANSGVTLGRKDSGLATFTYLLSSARLGAVLLDSPEVTGLFYSGDYDVRTRTWRRPGGLVAWVKRSLRRLAGWEEWVPPDAVAASNKLNDVLSLSPESGSDIVTLSTTASSPADAELKLHWLLATADGLSKQDERRRIDDDIAFLTDQLSSVRLQEHRDQLTARLSVAVRKQTMLAANHPYNFMVITPVQAGTLPSSPRLGTVLTIGVGFGIAIGLLVAALWRPRKS